MYARNRCISSYLMMILEMNGTFLNGIGDCMERNLLRTHVNVETYTMSAIFRYNNNNKS
jgi:hypothetical protein